MNMKLSAMLIATGLISGATWAVSANTGPQTREQVVNTMREEKANGCWELTQFHYPAPYDAPLRAHVLAMQQAAAKNGSEQ